MPAALKSFLKRPVNLRRLKIPPRRVRMALTPSGWGFGGLILCGFLLSVNFSNNLIFAMTFLLVSIAMVGWYHTRMNVRGLALAQWRCEPVFAGQDAVYRLTVENSSRTGRYGLRTASGRLIGGEERHLAGRERIELLLKRPAPSRGRLKSVPADIRSSFPLGLFRARLVTGPLPECLVYPAPAGRQPLPDGQTGRQAHLLAESGTYTDMRRYAPGDPLSRIHWKAMARFDELYTKEFDGAQGKPALWLRWEDVLAGDMEQKLSQLCRWAIDAHHQAREFGLALPGTTIEPAREEAHLRACLQALALYGQGEKR